MITIAKKGALGPHVGQPVRRIDARKKVTGTAAYAAEHPAPDLLHGVVVNATIARGKITELDATAALAVPGVLHVFSHENRPSLPWFDKKYSDEDAPAGHPFRPLHDAEIQFDSQPIALVVASTLEAARHAAGLVRVVYEQVEHVTSIRQNLGEARPPKKWTGGRKGPPKPRGDLDRGLLDADVKVDAEYTHLPEYHNPMELFATTVIVEEDGTFSIYDKTQGPANSLTYATNVFGLSKGEARVRTPFMGGGFGSGLRPQHQLFFAMLAARELKRSVRVELRRQQMFTFGHRPSSIMNVALGATREGALTAMRFDTKMEASRFEDYVETTVNWGPVLYACENTRFSHDLVPVDVYTPLDMRAPGATSGVFAFESAMDELAHALAMDPVAFRAKNLAPRAIDEDKEFGSNAIAACYRDGAARFGWDRRSAAPRSMRDGRKLVGWGMASGIWDAQQMYASARARIGLDGRLEVASATADIGTGTYTIMTQIAADALGLSLDEVTFKLGDTDLPEAPLVGGSWTAVTVGSAVKAACDALGKKLARLAGIEDATFADGCVVSAADPTRRVSFVEALRAGGQLAAEATETAVPSPERLKYAHYVRSAVFVEVKVDEDLGTIEVARVVSAIAAGKILNPRTARSQIMGGIVWGISQALHEEALYDHRFGRVMNHSLAEYHVSVNRDVGEVDIAFVEEHDEHVNALGAKGVGEIGQVGVAAAVANAVFHATGRRVRDLPITLDKLL